MTMHAPALITVLTAFLLCGVGLNAGIRRAKYGIKAPATTGDPRYETAYRIQMNTVEQSVPFLAALWVFAIYVSTTWAGLLGGLWLLARILYVVEYTAAPEKRTPGFLIAFVSFACLSLGGLFGVIRAFFA